MLKTKWPQYTDTRATPRLLGLSGWGSRRGRWRAFQRPQLFVSHTPWTGGAAGRITGMGKVYELGWIKSNGWCQQCKTWGCQNRAVNYKDKSQISKNFPRTQNLEIALDYRYSIVKTGRGVAEVKMPRIIIQGYRCQRCNHHWAPRNGTGYRDKEDPKTCPRCKSPYWNKPRVNRARNPVVMESGATPHVQVEGYQCDRCGHRWSHPDGKGRWPHADPKQCPKCRSPYWDKPRQRNIAPDRTAASRGLSIKEPERVA